MPRNPQELLNAIFGDDAPVYQGVKVKGDAPPPVTALIRQASEPTAIQVPGVGPTIAEIIDQTRNGYYTPTFGALARQGVKGIDPNALLDEETEGPPQPSVTPTPSVTPAPPTTEGPPAPQTAEPRLPEEEIQLPDQDKVSRMLRALYEDDDFELTAEQLYGLPKPRGPWPTLGEAGEAAKTVNDALVNGIRNTVRTFQQAYPEHYEAILRYARDPIVSPGTAALAGSIGAATMLGEGGPYLQSDVPLPDFMQTPEARLVLSPQEFQIAQGLLNIGAVVDGMAADPSKALHVYNAATKGGLEGFGSGVVEQLTLDNIALTALGLRAGKAGLTTAAQARKLEALWKNAPPITTRGELDAYVKLLEQSRDVLGAEAFRSRILNFADILASGYVGVVGADQVRHSFDTPDGKTDMVGVATGLFQISLGMMGAAFGVKNLAEAVRFGRVARTTNFAPNERGRQLPVAPLPAGRPVAQQRSLPAGGEEPAALPGGRQIRGLLTTSRPRPPRRPQQLPLPGTERQLSFDFEMAPIEQVRGAAPAETIAQSLDQIRRRLATAGATGVEALGLPEGSGGVLLRGAATGQEIPLAPAGRDLPGGGRLEGQGPAGVLRRPGLRSDLENRPPRPPDGPPDGEPPQGGGPAAPGGQGGPPAPSGTQGGLDFGPEPSGGAQAAGRQGSLDFEGPPKPPPADQSSALPSPPVEPPPTRIPSGEPGADFRLGDVEQLANEFQTTPQEISELLELVPVRELDAAVDMVRAEMARGGPAQKAGLVRDPKTNRVINRYGAVSRKHDLIPGLAEAIPERPSRIADVLSKKNPKSTVYRRMRLAIWRLLGEQKLRAIQDKSGEFPRTPEEIQPHLKDFLDAEWEVAYTTKLEHAATYTLAEMRAERDLLKSALERKDVGVMELTSRAGAFQALEDAIRRVESEAAQSTLELSPEAEAARQKFARDVERSLEGQEPSQETIAANAYHRWWWEGKEANDRRSLQEMLERSREGPPEPPPDTPLTVTREVMDSIRSADDAVSGRALPAEVQAAADALPPPPEGTTRLWRVEGASAAEAGGAAGRAGGRWFEENLGAYVTEATRAGDVRYVDVPTRRLEQLRSDPNATEVQLPEGYVAQARALTEAAEGGPPVPRGTEPAAPPTASTEGPPPPGEPGGGVLTAQEAPKPKPRQPQQRNLPGAQDFRATRQLESTSGEGPLFTQGEGPPAPAQTGLDFGEAGAVGTGRSFTDPRTGDDVQVDSIVARRGPGGEISMVGTVHEITGGDSPIVAVRWADGSTTGFPASAPPDALTFNPSGPQPYATRGGLRTTVDAYSRKVVDARLEGEALPLSDLGATVRKLKDQAAEGKLNTVEAARAAVLERILRERSQPTASIPDDPGTFKGGSEAGAMRPDTFIPGVERLIDAVRRPPQHPLDDLGDNYSELATRRVLANQEQPSFVRRWLDDSHTMADVLVTNFYDRFLPVRRMRENVEAIIGRPLKAHEDAGMILDLEFGGGMGKARVAIHQLRQIKKAAEKIGELPNLIRVLDYRGWQRRLRMSEADLALLQTEDALRQEIISLRRSVGSHSGNITKLDRKIDDAVRLGNLELAQRYRQSAARARGRHSNVVRELNRMLKEDATLKRVAKDRGLTKRRRELERDLEEGKLVPLGFTPEDLARSMEALRQRLGPERWQQVNTLADRTFAVGRRVLDFYFAEGLISGDAYAKLLSFGDDYVPLYRIMDVLDDNIVAASANPELMRKELELAAGGIGSLSIGRLKYFQRFRGSELDTIDPIDAMAYAFQRAIQDVARNRSARSVVRMATMTPDVAEATGVLKIRRGRGAPPVSAQVRQLEKKHGRSYDTLSFFTEGRAQTWAVPSEIAAVMRWVAPADIDIMNGVMKWFSTTLRLGATSARLSFALPNVIRDVARMRDISDVVTDTSLDIPLVGKVSSAAVPGLRTARSFKLWVEGFRHVIAKDEWWRGFNENGGAFSTISSRINPARDLALPGEQSLGNRGYREAMRMMRELKIGKGLAETGFATITKIEQFNNILEEATKVAAYKAMIQRLERQGVPLNERTIRAAWEARRFAGTPDAARRGMRGDSLNLLFMFWNVQLQGKFMDLGRIAGRTAASGSTFELRRPHEQIGPVKADRMLRGKTAGGFDARKARKYLVPMIYSATMGNLIMAATHLWSVPKHRDGRMMIEHVPRDTRARNFIVFNPYGEPDANGVLPYWKIPKPQTYARIWNPLEEAWIAELSQGDTTSKTQQALDAMAHLAPASVELDRHDMLGSGVRSFLASVNPAIGAPVQLFANTNFFTGIPLHSAADERSLPQNRFSATTSPTAVALGKGTGFSRLTGLSPKQIEAAIRMVFAGLGEEVLSLSDAAVRGAGIPEKLGQERIDARVLERYPLVSSITRAFYDPARRDNVIEEMSKRFYAERARLEQQIRDHRIGRSPLTSSEYTAKRVRAKQIESAARQLSELRQQIRDAPDRRETSQQHKQILRILERLITLTGPAFPTDGARPQRKGSTGPPPTAPADELLGL